MNNLPESLKKAAEQLLSYTSDEQVVFIDELYSKYNMSYPEIAKLAGTYPNKIRRLATRNGVKSRDKSQAQKIALDTGRHNHPTKGKKHSEKSKLRISEAMATSWSGITDVERARRSQMAKDQWESMSIEEQEEFRRLASNAVREAAKNGSKLEHYLMTELIGLGYRVEFHKEHMVKNDRLQVDLFLPKLNTAIEVDGPSHFKPIWGDEVLKRNLKADAQKDGLLLGMGMCVVRIRQTKGLSEKYKRDLLSQLAKTIGEIEAKFPDRSKRHIILGEV
jgi:very-short-patch-repair endonuclease